MTIKLIHVECDSEDADRMRTVLQLIASLPVHPVGDPRNRESLALARSAARGALKTARHVAHRGDPMCEVLR